MNPTAFAKRGRRIWYQAFLQGQILTPDQVMDCLRTQSTEATRDEALPEDEERASVEELRAGIESKQRQIDYTIWQGVREQYDPRGELARLFVGSLLPERYRPLSYCGRGGNGQVWAVRDTVRGCNLALKRMPAGAGDPKALVGEYRVGCTLTYPGVPSVFDLGTDALGQPFFTMQLVVGPTLREAILQLHADSPTLSSRNRRQELHRLLDYFQEGAKILHTAHRDGTAHGDAHADNFICTENGQTVVIDWSHAAQGGETPASPVLKEQTYRLGNLFGTAPERFTDPPDAQTDIYSLGAILYQLLTNQYPPERRTMDVALAAPRDVKRGVESSLSDICMRAMAAERKRRYETVEEFLNDLGYWRSGGWLGQHQRMVRRIGFLLVGVAGLGLGGFLWSQNGRRQVAEERDRVAIQERHTQAALNLTEEVLSNTTDNAFDLFGRQPVLSAAHRQFLENTVRSYRRLAEQPATGTDARIRIAAARRRLSEIHWLLGNLQAAEKDAREAAELLTTVQADAQGKTAAARLERIRCQYQLGWLHARGSRHELAKEHFQQALALLPELPAEAPADVNEMREVARVRMELGDLLTDQQDPAAIAELDKAEELGIRLVKHADSVEDDRVLLGDIRACLGEALLRNGDLERSRQVLLTGVNDVKELRKRSPKNHTLRALAGLQNKLGLVWKLSGRFAEAKQELLAAMEDQGILARQMPQVPEMGHNYAECHYQLARLYQDWQIGREQGQQVKFHIDAALQAISKVVTEWPAEPRYRYERARCLLVKAEWAQDEDAYVEAVNLCSEAISMLVALKEQYPRVPGYAEELARGLRCRASLQRGGQRGHVEKDFREALNILQELWQAHPRSRQHSLTLAQAHIEHALWLSGGDRNDQERSEEEIEATYRILNPRLPQQPVREEEVTWVACLANAHRVHSALRARQNRYTESLQDSERAATLALPIADRGHNAMISLIFRDRATLFNRWKRYEAAVEAWSQAYRYADEVQRLTYLIHRARSHALNGSIALAEKDMAAARRASPWSHGQFLNAGRCYAILSGKSPNDQERLGSESIRLLKESAAVWPEPTLAALPLRLKDVVTEPDFDAVRQRPDFAALVTELERKVAEAGKKARPAPPPKSPQR